MGAKRPGYERARERKFQGANWPGSYWPIRSGERIGPGAKRLGTIIFRAPDVSYPNPFRNPAFRTRLGFLCLGTIGVMGSWLEAVGYEPPK